MGGGGVQRTVKFARYLRDHAWEPVVIAPSINGEMSWQDESPLDLIKSEQVLRVGSGPHGKGKIAKVCRRLLPVDAFFNWSKAVFGFCVANQLTTADVVLTSGPPHSVHRAGYLLAKNFGMKWVADFRDHFTLGPEYRPVSLPHAIFDRRFERAILETADVIVCNTRINRRELLAAFGYKYGSKVTTIYNGFDRTDLQPSSSEPQLTAGKRLVYLYLGGLRGGEIDDSFFRIVERLGQTRPAVADEFCFRIVGDSSRRTPLVDRLVEQKLVELAKPVPSNALGDVLRSADACVTWQRDSKKYRGTIAGKVFDYLAAERPVFALGQEDGEVARLLKRFGLGLCISPTDTEVALERLLTFHETLQAGGFCLKPLRHGSIDHFSRQYQAGQLAQIFNSLTIE
jgi:glycosyltransferase involved in cell wall biosynthesis